MNLEWIHCYKMHHSDVQDPILKKKVVFHGLQPKNKYRLDSVTGFSELNKDSDLKKN